ncbi:MAG: class I SAM-dependent methyltransferase [Solirubrobacteraceae bacterium]|nr:class I SAM-dependent methyltransferase [Solirubrobacteraceae bacterium]
MTAPDLAARTLALSVLSRIRHGRITVLEPGHRRRDLGRGDGPQATVRIRDPRAWRALLGGSLPLADAYAAGWWDADDLVGVFRIGAANMRPLDTARRWATPLREPFQRLRAAGTSAGIAASRDDIHAHYDLGNDFFAEMLDETMMYSAGYFEGERSSLHEASLAKLELVCAKLGLGPDDHVLEIGTGWGGFAVHAAATTGCRVTTTTISDEQHAYATERVRAADLDDRVTVLNRDYRLLDGKYTALVSLEMIEAVGWRDFNLFMRTCAERLTDDGRMLLQAITMTDRAFPVEKASRSFIRTRIFPNGCLPSPAVLARHAGRNELQIVDHQDLTWHYARTLAAWRSNLLDRAQRLEELGYDEEFRRMWQLYLAYCEAGFAERRIQVGQTMYAKARWRGGAPAARQTELPGVDALHVAPGRDETAPPLAPRNPSQRQA